MKIDAAVVTHKRCKLLGRCIGRLQSQTRPPDQVIVISNSSADCSVDMLNARGVSLIMQESTGSCGGWPRRIQYAMDEDFDAIWLMDDDGFPHEDALVRLEGR
jgi:rhamnopyranosyl-N-acetylglucosaminyl-diphospho-decaprenol beta-1,3/1,4-galactofuranosyltransferase